MSESVPMLQSGATERKDDPNSGNGLGGVSVTIEGEELRESSSQPSQHEETKPLPAPEQGTTVRPVPHHPPTHREPSKPGICAAFCCIKCCLAPKEEQLGNSRRLCGSDLIVTPLVWGGWIVFLVNVLALGAYTAFTPALDHWWMLILIYIAFIITVYFMCRSQCSDPGVVPRGRPLPTFPTFPNVVESHAGTTVNGMLIDPKDYVGLDGENLVIWRWCTTCSIHRPPRSAHCNICDWCVKEFDHHCPVMGSCVGERTIRYFTLALVMLTVQCGIMFTSCVYFVISHDWDEVDTGLTVWQTICIFGCGMVACVGGCWSSAMGSTYIYMACIDRTLRERVRGMTNPSAASADHPNGCSRCLSRLFGKETPSYLTQV